MRGGWWCLVIYSGGRVGLVIAGLEGGPRLRIQRTRIRRCHRRCRIHDSSSSWLRLHDVGEDLFPYGFQITTVLSAEGLYRCKRSNCAMRLSRGGETMRMHQSCKARSKTFPGWLWPLRRPLLKGLNNHILRIAPLGVVDEVSGQRPLSSTFSYEGL